MVNDFVYLNNGVWTNAKGKIISRRYAHAVTGLRNTKPLGEYTEARAVADYEKLRDAENN
jgi:hypothetical protein